MRPANINDIVEKNVILCNELSQKNKGFFLVITIYKNYFTNNIKYFKQNSTNIFLHFMFIVLLIFLTAMISYLIHAIYVAKLKANFTLQIDNLKDENSLLEKNVQSLKLKEDFYSNIYDQLERKNAEIAKLTNEIMELKNK